MQSLGVASIVYGASKLFFWQPILYPIFASYLLFQLVYIFDRYHDLNDDYSTNKTRSEHLLSYAQYIPIIFLIYLIALVVILWQTSQVQGIIFTFFILFMGILYPIFFKNLTRHIFLFKNLYVSSVFGLMALYGNIYFYIAPISYSFAIFVFLYIFLETMIMQFMLDCKDTVVDGLKSLKTLPVRFGVERAVAIIYVIIFIKATLYIFLAYSNLTEGLPQFIYLIGATTLINLVAIYLIAKNNSVGYLLSAGKFLLWSIIFSIKI